MSDITPNHTEFSIKALQKTTVRQTITVYSDAEKTTPKDISGASIVFAVHDGDVEQFKLRETDPGITITDAANGEFEIEMSPSDLDLDVDTYTHEGRIQLVDDEDVPFSGDFQVKESKTKDEFTA